eukprot:NODE_712_length_4879_cov_0.214435.p1 type:complete len:649 gc:universal NODE_712_length_4879_cov_0.214435:2165-219(-)
MNLPTIDIYRSANTLFQDYIKSGSKANSIKANEVIVYFSKLQELGIPLQFKSTAPHPLIVLFNRSDTPLFINVLKQYILFYMPILQADAICTDVLEGNDLSDLLFDIQRKRKAQVNEAISKYSVPIEIPNYDQSLAYLFIWSENISIKKLNIFKDYDRIEFLLNSIDYMLQHTLSDDIMTRIAKVVVELTKMLASMNIMNTTTVYLQYKCIQYLKTIYSTGYKFKFNLKCSITNILSMFLFLHSYFTKSSVQLSNSNILEYYKKFLTSRSALLLPSCMLDEVQFIINDAFVVSMNSASLDIAFEFVKSNGFIGTEYMYDIIDALGLNRFEGKKLTNLVDGSDARLFRIVLKNANLYDSKSHYFKVAKLFYAAEKECQDPLLLSLLEHHSFLTESHLFKSNIIETAGIEWITIKSTPYFLGLCDVFEPSIGFTVNYDDKPKIQELLCTIMRLNRAFYLNIPLEIIVRHGVISFLIVLLSSVDPTIQCQARFHLEYIVNEISRSDIQDKKKLVVAINKVRNCFDYAYPNPEGLPLQSVPYSFAYFVAIGLVISPTHFMYSAFMHHLYSSPLYSGEPPLFQSLFHEPSTVRRKHRIYIIELLVKGMKSYLDKKVYYKWHVLDVLKSFKETFVCTPEEGNLIIALEIKMSKF